MADHNTEAYSIGAERLKAFLEEMQIHASDFAELVGVSAGTPSGWIRKNQMPKWVLLAIEALRKSQPVNVRLIVTPGSKLDAVKSVLNAMSVPFKEI